MSRSVIVSLRAALVLVSAGTLTALIAIVVATTVSLGDGPAFPGVLHSAAAVGALVCLQVCLVAIWALLSMVRRDAIFDERAFRWVPVIAVAGMLAAFAVGAVCMHVGELDDAPGLVLIGGGIGVIGIAFALLMTVMLGLLRNATQLRRELEQVV